MDDCILYRTFFVSVMVLVMGSMALRFQYSHEMIQIRQSIKESLGKYVYWVFFSRDDLINILFTKIRIVNDF